MNDFYAHSHPDSSDRELWQPLDQHLRKTAELAAGFSAAWNAQDWGRLAGLWHDFGKYSKEFQTLVLGRAHDDSQAGPKARVDHSSAGAQHALEALEAGPAKVLAFVITGHHGGLLDGKSADASLEKRLEKPVPDFRHFPPEFGKALPLSLPFEVDPKRQAMQLSLFIRMVYSALVDADYLDTEAYLDRDRSRSRQGFHSLSELAGTFNTELEKLTAKSKDTPVNRRRSEVLSDCLTAAEEDPGLYSLTVPTGGGKTLSSMAFALRHALKHDLRRIIYVLPYTSIIEQNAQVFRDFLGPDAVVEHHSNFDPSDEDPRTRLAAENWDAPIIVTTTVQFFESLFSNRPSRCRKLHNIARSVVVLDEVQTLPAEFLRPCIEVLKELASTYRVTAVLCSATQPAITEREDFEEGLSGVREIVEKPEELATALKRTEVSVVGKLTDDDLIERLESERQVLCIVNTRRQARELFERLPKEVGTYHLSALMCPAHRSKKLKEIRERLGRDQPCRVISTQLIEAGVDIDFPTVYRTMVGIDSIAQAAGRCNREGRLERGNVYVFEPERGTPPGHFRQTAQAALSVIRKHADDILSLAAIDEYFRLYYWSRGDDLDKFHVMRVLQDTTAKLDYPFRAIAETFGFIRDGMRPVVIPYDDNARKAIDSLDYVDRPGALSRRLQKYTVSLHPREWNALAESGAVEMRGDTFPVLIEEGLYSEDVGLNPPETRQFDPEQYYI